MPIIFEPQKIRIIKPTELVSFGLDHTKRPIRIAIFNDNNGNRIVYPEYFSIDNGNHWIGNSYDDLSRNIKKLNCEVIFLQGDIHQYILHKDGSFEISPLIQDKFFPKLKVRFEGEIISMVNSFPYMKYFVHAIALGDAPRFQGGFVKAKTSNIAINLGWRNLLAQKDGHFIDLTVLLHVFANEQGATFRVQASEYYPKSNNKPKKFYNVEQQIDFDANELIIRRKIA